MLGHHHVRFIKNTADLRSTLRSGNFTSLGGYPVFLLTSDGATLHVNCAKAEYRVISAAIRHNLKDGWKVEFCEVNWEDADMYCACCNEPIESAYAG